MTARELKEQRAELGLTQEELAKRLQVNWRTVARYESGEAKIPHVVALALSEIKRQDLGA